MTQLYPNLLSPLKVGNTVLRNFKNYLIRQVNKSAIEVRLNTRATPERLRAGRYDHVAVAIGPKPQLPPIPGLDTVPALIAEDIFVNNRQAELAEDVVIIGGGDIGVETGLYLAEHGHKVFVLEMQPALCMDTTPVHYRAMVEDYWLAQPNFSFEVNARCTEVSPQGVSYIDGEGNQQFAAAGSILFATGMSPRTEEAMSYFGVGTYTTVIGDCDKPESVQRAMRAGYEAGVKI